ncbi:restriction endonuclease [[Ruminococcus] torques]|uniref:restriction endonuclease n=1 Tax=[Ruminococcus] torques TaxID=33039 RepID=UPI003AB92E78
MARPKKILSPTYTELIIPTYQALIELGGSGTNNEICERVIKNMHLTDEVVDEPHLGSTNQSELEYQLAWARTYLKNYGVIENSARSVWSITSAYTTNVEINAKEIVAFTANKNAEKRLAKKKKTKNTVSDKPEDDISDNDDTEFPEEIKPWRQHLAEVLMNMDPYGFERLSQRVLRECGFTQVEVTKKSGDGGIDGIGKLKINGIFSFNVAFQCKRYKGLVSAGDIRDFRGSLTTDIEKGVFITTGTFSKAAKEEASNPGKQQIDLIDGEEFINKLVEYRIGVREVKTYEVIEEFFAKI